MKKVVLTILTALAIGSTVVSAAEEKQNEVTVADSEVLALENVVASDSQERAGTLLPPPPPGYVWIITTCRVYLVPTIYSPTTLANMALYYQSLCDKVEISPR